MEIDYRTEHYRMLMVLESIHNLTGEMLEPERRAGPTGGRILPVPGSGGRVAFTQSQKSKTQNSKNLRDKPDVHQVMRELRLKDD